MIFLVHFESCMYILSNVQFRLVSTHFNHTDSYSCRPNIMSGPATDQSSTKIHKDDDDDDDEDGGKNNLLLASYLF